MISVARKPVATATLLWLITCLTVLVACVATGCNTSGSPSPKRSVEPNDTAHRDLIFRYEVDVRGVPADAGSAFLWVPVPPTTTDQEIHNLKVESTLPYVEVSERRYGNSAI